MTHHPLLAQVTSLRPHVEKLHAQTLQCQPYSCVYVELVAVKFRPLSQNREYFDKICINLFAHLLKPQIE